MGTTHAPSTRPPAVAACTAVVCSPGPRGGGGAAAAPQLQPPQPLLPPPSGLRCGRGVAQGRAVGRGGGGGGGGAARAPLAPRRRNTGNLPAPGAPRPARLPPCLEAM